MKLEVVILSHHDEPWPGRRVESRGGGACAFIEGVEPPRVVRRTEAVGR